MPSWLEGTRPLWKLWSKPPSRADAGTDELCSLVLRDDDYEITLVRTLSLPNPLALVGNPLRCHGRFRADYQDNFDDRTRIGGNLVVSQGLPIGFDTEWNYWQHEGRRLPPDDSWTGDFNLVFRFGRFRSHEFRTGAGLNWLDDEDGTRLGWNTTYAFDYNFYGPWIMSASLDVGRLGSDGLLHGRITGGLELGRFELFAGYDFYEVGDRERKGPVAGVGLWF